jgi:hypothetical protein
VAGLALPSAGQVQVPVHVLAGVLVEVLQGPGFVEDGQDELEEEVVFELGVGGVEGGESDSSLEDGQLLVQVLRPQSALH